MNAELFSSTVDSLRIRIFPDRGSLGAAAAAAVAVELRTFLHRQQEVRMVFAAAPSQNEFLESLIAEQGIEWNRVRAFHMDEYLGLPSDAPQRFAQFLKPRLFERVPFRSVEYLNPGELPEVECRRYAQLLQEAPIDIVCLGIGENGHIAFNDPPVADFHDPVLVKKVVLDDRCRLQQVHDGSFASAGDVPKEALTLTIPALLSGKKLSIVVPGSAKAEAVKAAVHGTVSTLCPASILRTHKCATLYLDRDSASLLQGV